MTPAQLAEIKARCEAATAGPWSVYDSNSWLRIGIKGWYQEIITPTNQNDGHPDLEAERADLEFIAAARTDVPALIAEVERLREALDNIYDRHADLKPMQRVP